MADDLTLLKTTLAQIDAASKQIRKDWAKDPKKLGELSGKGLSLDAVDDVNGAALSLRVARVIIRKLIEHDESLGSPVVDAASDSTPTATEETTPVSGTEESKSEPATSAVPAGETTVVQPNRKARRAAAKKGKGPAVAGNQ